MTRVAEPMIDLHQALHDTKMIDAASSFGRAAWEKGPMVMKAATIRVVKARGFFQPSGRRSSA
jgi:hypothetical protein